MPVYVAVEVVGLKEAFKELNSFDKKLRRQITRDYKAIVEPIAADARAAIGQIDESAGRPMSGWQRNWNPAHKRKKQWIKKQPRDKFTEQVRIAALNMGVDPLMSARASGAIFPWDNDPAKRMIKAKINTKQPRQFAGAMRNLQIFTLSWLGAANEIFEMAGRESSGKTPQGRRMIATLNQRYGKPGRILWNSYEKNREHVDKELVKLVERVMAAVNRKAIFTQNGKVR